MTPVVAEIERVLREHRPSGRQWDCTCGGMGSATFRTHDAAHRAHLAQALGDAFVTLVQGAD